MFFSDVKFVSHYSPPIEYKRNGKIGYTFIIDEETHLGSHSAKNNYSQNVLLTLNYTSNKLYHFDVKTTKQEFKLEQDLAQQGKLLEHLSKLTEDIEIAVNENGSIESFDSKELLKKWETMKPRLLEMFRSSQAKAYISDFDTCIKKEGFLLQELRQPQLCGLLFDGFQTLHEKDKPRRRTINNFIYGIPFSFEEQVSEVKEENQKRYITLKGNMEDLTQINASRIEQYFKRYGVNKTDSWSVKYIKHIVLDMKTGYFDKVDFKLEVSNGSGYTQKRTFTLNRQANG